jgi:hypothetical protein
VKVEDSKTYKAPFEVYLPATSFCKTTGKPENAKYIKTIMIDVYDNFGYQMLTPQAHIDIDRERILAYFAELIQDDVWVDTPNKLFNNKKPIDMINDADGQLELIKFIISLRNSSND